MHEVSIAHEILNAVKNRMAAYGLGAQAKCVAIRCGEFRNVDPGSLQFAFESLRKDDISTQDCRLNLEIVPTIATCRGGHEFYPQASDYYACTTCGEGIERLLQGEELDVVQVVIETDD